MDDCVHGTPGRGGGRRKASCSADTTFVTNPPLRNQPISPEVNRKVTLSYRVKSTRFLCDDSHTGCDTFRLQAIGGGGGGDFKGNFEVEEEGGLVTSNPDDRVPSRSRSTDRDVNQRAAFDFWRDATGNIS